MLKLSIIIFLSIFLSAGSLYSQFDVLEKVKEKAEEKIDEGLEEDTNEEEVQEEEESVIEEQKEESTETEKIEVKQEEKAALKSYSKFDFVPGENILFYEDFSQDNIGDFPSLWNTNSSGEVVTLNNYPGHWLQYGNDGSFLPDIKGTFGENFTMEFDLVYGPTTQSNLPTFYLDFISGILEGETLDAYVPGNGGCQFKIGAYSTGVSGWKDQNYSEISNTKDNEFLLENMNQKAHLAFSFQKQRVRIWLNEQKVFDLPKLLPSGLVIDRLRFSTEQTDDQNPYLYINNIRVAVGPPDMRSKLITEGKLVTRGILFDVNSDKIKPESYGTLKEIANVLKENAGVRVKIIGHTDSDGEDNSNLELSKKRSVSVKNTLSAEFGIDASRLETDGKGESQPSDNNTTSQGKANNRRVEFIKL
jgi:outer membrane protein OmpA-like peptidoglycan-associated protein